MSTKSQNQTKRGRTPESPESELFYAESTDIYRLTGEQQETFESLVTGVALLARAPDPLDPNLTDEQIDELEVVHKEFNRDAIDEEAMDVMAANAALTGLVGLTTRALARWLLEQVLGYEPAPRVPNELPDADESDVPNQADALAELTAALAPSGMADSIELSRSERRDAIDEAHHLLREVGLEEFDVSCALFENADGTVELEAIPIDAPTAHAALLDYVFDRAEVVVQTVPLLTGERVASNWEFSRWSAGPKAGQPSLPLESVGDMRAIREQEYSLARRPTVALGGSVIGEIVADDVYAELCPRQHRVAESLVASFVGVFECVAHAGDRATLKTVRDEQTMVVHEYADPPSYAPGWVGLGRVLPFDDTSYVRSPGMVWTKPPNAGFAMLAAKTFDELCETLAPDLAIEAVIASVLFGVRVPREVKAARSRAIARDILIDLIELLIDAPEPDKTLEDYMDALTAQARAGEEGTASPNRAKPKKAKQKSKRRR